MDKNYLARTKCKFEVAYFTASQQLPMTKYEEFLKLKQKHGTNISSACLTNQYCGIFIDFCGNKTIRIALFFHTR